MRTDFADFPLPSPPARSGGGASAIDRRERGAGERDQRFTLPQETRGDTRPGRDAGAQGSSAQGSSAQGSEAGERGARGADAQARKADDAQARKATDAKEASGKASPDKPSREGDAAGNKLSDAAPDAGASDNDRPAGAKLRAMGAVSLIALMRTGSAESRDDASDTGPAASLLADPENNAEADPEALLESAPGKADALHFPPEEILGEQTGEDDDPRVAGDEQPVDLDAATPSDEAELILAEGEDQQMQDDAADDEATDDADAATQAATASAQNASARNADPARGALPAQASDAARAALARAPGLAGRTTGAEGGAVASGDQGADAQAGEDAQGEGASTALKTDAGEGRVGAERLAGVDQEAARRGAAEAGANANAPTRQGASADEVMKAFEAFKPGATTASSENAGQQQTQPALDAAKAAAGAQPAQTNGAVLVNTPLSAVPLALGMKAMAGASRFEIRLDPAELGRIDVRLDIDKEGNVKARLTVDRVETLHLLQRDARTLERAFEQAGLKPSEEGIDLSLRDDRGGESRRETRDGDDETGPQPRGAGIEEAGRSEAEIRALAHETLLVRQAMRQALGGVDLSI